MSTTFGANLARLRRAKLLEVNDICTILGIDTITWQYIELGLTEPSMDQIDKVARFFAVSPADLFMPITAPTAAEMVGTAGIVAPAKKYVFNKKLTIASLIISTFVLMFLFVPAFGSYSFWSICLNRVTSDAYIVIAILVLLVELWFIISLIISLCIKKNTEFYHNWIRATRLIAFICSLGCYFIYNISSIVFLRGFQPVGGYSFLYCFLLTQAIINIVMFAKRKTR